MSNLQIPYSQGIYPSLHLVDVKDSHVVVVQSISRAIHVTSCSGTSITATCQQLRLHESVDLQLHVTVSAGAIMEESRGIVFFSPDHLDVKDFDWLRANVPSPNFSLQKTSKALASKTTTVPVQSMEQPSGGQEQSSSDQALEEDEL